MPDPRFFEDLGPVTLGELAELTGSELSSPEAGERRVRGVAILSQAGADTITFLNDRKHAAGLSGLTAAACFITSRDKALLP